MVQFVFTFLGQQQVVDYKKQEYEIWYGDMI